MACLPRPAGLARAGRLSLEDMFRDHEQSFLELARDLDVEAFWRENELCGKVTDDKRRCGLFTPPTP